MAVAEKELKAFIYLAEQANFKRASELAHLTPSALTRMIQRLEERLATELFYRNKRQVDISPAGQQFYNYAKNALQDWNELNHQIQMDKNEIKGRLSLYCSVTAAYGILTKLLPMFRKSYPDIDIHLRTGDPAQAIERLLNGQEELVISAKPHNLPSKLLYKEVTSSRLLLIVPKIDCQVKQQWQDSHQSLDALPWIISESGIVRERFDQWAKQQPQKPRIYNEVSGHEGIVSMVSLGFGVGLVPEIVLEHSPQKNNIQVVKQRLEIEDFSIGLCVQKHTLKNPVVNALWQLV